MDKQMTINCILCVLLTHTSELNAKVTVEIQLVEFENLNALMFNGDPCDYNAECEHFFKFCVDDYPSDKNINSGNCLHYWGQSSVFGSTNRNDLLDELEGHGVPNPIVISGLVWTGAVAFKVDVFDDDGNDDPEHVDMFFETIATFKAANNASAPWLSFPARGARRNDKSILDFNYRVYCDAGYFGPMCDCQEYDNDVDGHYTCHSPTGTIICRPGWEDTSNDCLTPVNDCVTHSCINGASCVDAHINYTCNCASGWAGFYCDINVDECLSDPCQNGGICHDVVDGWVCVCQPGYFGDACEYHVCDYETSCLNNGTCNRDTGTCNCHVGYTGYYCETYMCDKTCENNATCDVPSGICQCLVGYTGELCESVICDLVPCSNNSVCDWASGVCQCDVGYIGTYCDTYLCDQSGCANGATCVEMTGECICPEGFTGSRCEIDMCQDVVCFYGATCQSGVCYCVPGYHGESCEFKDPLMTGGQIAGTVCGAAGLLALILGLSLGLKKKKIEESIIMSPVPSISGDTDATYMSEVDLRKNDLDEEDKGFGWRFY